MGCDGDSESDRFVIFPTSTIELVSRITGVAQADSNGLMYELVSL